ncbi:MAG: tetratricopeptide repeat protein [Myxococcota bacterium]
MGQRWRWMFGATALSLAGCTHTPPPATVTRETDDRELLLLRERVGRLERRLSDLDAQLALLSDRVASPARDAVSAGAPLGGEYVPVTVPEGVGGARRPSWGHQAPQPLPPGLRSIDLQPRADPSEDDATPYDLPEDAVGDASHRAPDPASTAQPGPPEDRYAWARARMAEGRYQDAIAIFEDILEGEPAHALADNSLYWVGVCQLERGEARLAIQTWQSLPMKYPESAKIPDALFGTATAHEELGEPALAETLYDQLVAQHPKAERWEDARKSLARLRGAKRTAH